MLPFRNFGLPELILVLVLAILLFGPGRIAKLGSELGKGIRGFRQEMGPKSNTTPDDQNAA